MEPPPPARHGPRSLCIFFAAPPRSFLDVFSRTLPRLHLRSIAHCTRSLIVASPPRNRIRRPDPGTSLCLRLSLARLLALGYCTLHDPFSRLCARVLTMTFTEKSRVGVLRHNRPFHRRLRTCAGRAHLLCADKAEGLLRLEWSGSIAEQVSDALFSSTLYSFDPLLQANNQKAEVQESEHPCPFRLCDRSTLYRHPPPPRPTIPRRPFQRRTNLLR